ncbi:MAG: prepilin peptidase, partial [Planctomycetota bacterium]
MSYPMFVVLSAVVQVVFAAAFGACVGSLINVLVYRLPLGLGVVTPPSRCPSCETRLTWRENIPIFGWLALRGRCRFCRSPISSEYPLVEAFVATLFALVTLAWFALPADTQVFGVAMEAIRPEWTLNGFPKVWPAYIAILTLVSCLVAMTLVDAKTFTIPLVLAYVPVVAAVVFHLVLVLIAGERGLRDTAPGYDWIIPEPGPFGWALAGVAAGGVLGLIVSCCLLEFGWLRRSFADYDEWEATAVKEAEAEAAESGTSEPVTPGMGILDPEGLGRDGLGR